MLCIAYNHRKCGQIEMFLCILLEYYYYFAILPFYCTNNTSHTLYVVYTEVVHIKSIALFIRIGRAFHLDRQFE